MNRTKLKNYAPEARRDFIQAMTDRAAYYGLTAEKVEPVVERGDVAVIAGREHPRVVAEKRKALEDRIKRHGFGPTMDAMAYTWFNRLVAIRFMELHGYLDHGYRVLSHPEGKPTPELLEHAEHVELPGLKKDEVIDLKLAGNKESELYRLLLTAQCNALHTAMPFLFERIDDETELLLPDNLLHSDSLIRKLVGEIDEEDWREVEIIGWLYQFYISEKKDEVIGKVVASEDIPAATQLFTPNWIVKYLVQNTLGRQWLATYPQSALRQQMQYYIEPAEQTPEVLEQLIAITPTSLNPEDLTLLDPACGSGHILVEAYDLFKAIYQERGYRAKDIPALILQKNLFGLEIDDRAAQLASFALMMKARADDRRLFDNPPKLNVLAFQESKGLDADELTTHLQPFDVKRVPLAKLLDTFSYAKTFGSLIQIPPDLNTELATMAEGLQQAIQNSDLYAQAAAQNMLPLVAQASVLGMQFDAVVANPPYMGSNFYNSTLKTFIENNYQWAKGDLYTCFIFRNSFYAKSHGVLGMLTIPNWMFLTTYEALRGWLFKETVIETFSHNGRGVFGSDFGTCAFTVRRSSIPEYKGSYKRLFDKQGSVASNEELSDRFGVARRFSASAIDFNRIPGSPLAYWLSENVRNIFSTNKPIGSHVTSREGMTTADNDRFLRYWFETEYQSIGWGVISEENARSTGKKWFPYIKGGDYRKWYGNTELVVNWLDDGREIKSNIDSKTGRVRSHNYNGDYAFKSGFTWTLISSGTTGARFTDSGFMFDANGPMAFSSDDVKCMCVSMINSTLGSELLKALSPTLAFKHGHILNLPLPESSSLAIDLNSHVDELVSISRADWDLFEFSWGFLRCPIVCDVHKRRTVADSFDNYRTWASESSQRVRGLEMRINASLAAACGVSNEVDSSVGIDKVTLRSNLNYRYAGDSSVADKEMRFREDTTKEMLSYSIGCVMGRFSLDKIGLIYGHSGNQGFDPSQYKTFSADDDGVILLLETNWGIRSDATRRIVEFVGVAWPREHLEENLKSIADSLGPSNGEQARDTIRRYLATGFYKHHLSMYKKRPIYWLFSSGKQRAFQCLVYLHRYHEGTLARMRTEYVIPLQGQIAARIEQLEGDKAKATSTSHRNKLQKEQNDLKKQQAELFTFEEKLKHAADQKISLDLDDGVKVNYGKFGDLLAESKAITGGKDDE